GENPNCCSYGLHTFLWPQRQYNTRKIAKNFNTLVSSPPPPNPSLLTLRVGLEPTWQCQKYILSKTPLAQNYIKKICSLKTLRSSKEKLSQSVSVKTQIFFGHKNTHCTHKCFFANYARYT
ncbi:unnamed protein product, partial [Ixodes pacificus]